MPSPQGRLFYGWYVIASAFAVLFLVQGAKSIIGVTFKPIIAEFAWSRGDISLAVLLNMTVYALSMTVVGRLYDRFGARWVVSLSSLCLALGFVGVARATTLWHFLVWYGVVAAVGFGGTGVPLFAALASKWFLRHRGLAVSLALSGGCLGQFVVVHGASQWVLAHHWRGIYLFIGLLAVVVILALALAVIKNTPAEIGLRPLGALARESEAGGRVAAHEARRTPLHDRRLAEALRTPQFWLYLTIMFVCGGGDYLVMTHLVPMVTDLGISPLTAGGMLAWYGLLSLAGVLLTGRLTDRIGHRIPVVATFALRLLAFVWFLTDQGLFSCYLFSLVFGFTMLVTGPITATLLIQWYGLRHVGLISGVITTVHHLSGGLWAYGAGLVFDRSGTYRPVLILYAMACFIAVICGMRLKETYER